MNETSFAYKFDVFVHEKIVAQFGDFEKKKNRCYALVLVKSWHGWRNSGTRMRHVDVTKLYDFGDFESYVLVLSKIILQEDERDPDG